MRGDRAAVERILSRFHEADNMTDRLSALAIMTQAALPERQAALEAFYDRYRGDALVLEQMVRAPGDRPGAGDSRPRQGPAEAPGLQR